MTKNRQQGRGNKKKATRKRRQRIGNKKEATKKKRQERGDKDEATKKRQQGKIRVSVVPESEAGRKPEICLPGAESVGEPAVAV